MDIQIIDCLPSTGSKTGDTFIKNRMPNRSAAKKCFSQPLPDASFFVPNIDLAYFAAVLREQKHHVHLAWEKPGDAEFHFLSVNLHNWQESLLLGENLKNQTRGKVGVFGNFVTARPACFSETADYIFHGEIERIALDWNLAELPEQNIRCGYIHDLELLPFPAWDLFPVNQYRVPAVHRRGPVLPVLASRGCAYRCSVCPSQVNCDFRIRSATHLMEEIDYLEDKYQISGFVCLDPNFAISEDRLFEFCELLIVRGKDLRFSIRTHCSNLTPMMLEKLGPAGLRFLEIEIHPQPGCYRGDDWRDCEPQEHLRRVVETCRGMGIGVALYFLLDATKMTDADDDRVNDVEQALRPDASFVILMAPFAEEVCEAYLSHEGGSNGRLLHFLEGHTSPSSIHILRQQPFIFYSIPMREFVKLKKMYSEFLKGEARNTARL